MADQKLSVVFLAEIKQCVSSKTASLDKVYKLVVVTDDGSLMNLSTIAPDQLVKVTVELSE